MLMGIGGLHISTRSARSPNAGNCPLHFCDMRSIGLCVSDMPEDYGNEPNSLVLEVDPGMPCLKSHGFLLRNQACTSRNVMVDAWLQTAEAF
jgi:hypothetical protein